MTGGNWDTGTNQTQSTSRHLTGLVELVASCIPRKNGSPSATRVFLSLDHNGLERAGAVRQLYRTGDWKIVIFIHDLIPLTHPEYVVPATAPAHRQRLKTISECADLVICNSRYTDRMLHEYLGAEDLRIPPSLVAHLGVECHWRDDAASTKSEKPYFVVLGTIEGRKNHLMILNVWRNLTNQLGDKAPHLHVVGRRGWEAESVFDMLDRSEALRGKVHEHSSLSDAKLSSLIAGARALLFPSFVEGYGLPLVEALQSGIPAIVSDIDVFREIAGDTPEYVDCLDGPGWADRIAEYSLPASHDRARQLKRLSSFKAASWSNHFSAVKAGFSAHLFVTFDNQEALK
ncbi:glycosyltransferase family 4 protein [Roseibium hamelinense]|nr:glycosyltransferase family 1 protein [Roseibium hamelinense]